MYSNYIQAIYFLFVHKLKYINIEQGSHDELLEKQGEYSKLHKMAAI
ncbi:hypothetical protein [Clostridium sp. SM-530-WT-3G]|nr:hypothetical protein [Clostridium sp. SM-530-WT-3G]NME83875.1 hypothetical protein [Clostridium sp. SM-530-WT-3G]